MITNRDNAYLILLEDVRDNALTPRNVLRRLARSGGQVSRRQFWNAVKCSRDARHDGDFSRASTQHSRLSANMAVKRFDLTPERSDGSFDPHESKFAFLHWVRSPTPGVRLWGSREPICTVPQSCARRTVPLPAGALKKIDSSPWRVNTFHRLARIGARCANVSYSRTGTPSACTNGAKSTRRTSKES